MRESLMDIQTALSEIMKTRHELLISQFGENTEEAMDIENSTEPLIELRKELLNLSLDVTKNETLTIVKENVQRFRKFMDKLDSFNFKIPVEKAFQFEADADIDEIRNINKLKDLLKNYKYVVESQDILINKAVQNGSKIKTENHEATQVRMKLLDSEGMKRAKEFLNKQRAYFQECNKEFVRFFEFKK